MEAYKVYVITNMHNGKRYYGMTRQTLTKRMQSGYGYEKNPNLFKDIKKMGWSSFDVRIVQDGLSRREAETLEESLIAEGDTMHPGKGYNLRSGGYSNFPAPSVCRSISKAKMGHEVSQETRNKLAKYGRKAIAQYSLEGKLIAVHSSITDATNAVGGYKSNLWAVCQGRKRTSYGHTWRYFNAKRQEEKDRVKHG